MHGNMDVQRKKKKKKTTYRPLQYVINNRPLIWTSNSKKWCLNIEKYVVHWRRYTFQHVWYVYSSMYNYTYTYG